MARVSMPTTCPRILRPRIVATEERGGGVLDDPAQLSRVGGGDERESCGISRPRRPAGRRRRSPPPGR